MNEPSDEPSDLSAVTPSAPREDICRLIDSKFRERLTPCASSFVDVIELPGEVWSGLWRVTVWGAQGAIAADVDVEATGESDALAKACAVFAARSADEWREEMPAVFGEDGE